MLQCWLKAPHISSFLVISATRMSVDVSQVGVALFPSFNIFLSFLPFILIHTFQLLKFNKIQEYLQEAVVSH